MTLLLDEREVEDLLDMPSCLAAVRDAFIDLGNGEAANRPRTHTYSYLGDHKFYTFKTMDGGLPSIGLHALRLSSSVDVEFEYQGHMREEKLALAAGNRYVGLVMLFDISTTELVAILPDTGIQRMRVGATSGVAADVLARKDATSVGLIGTGWQAWPQLEALSLVRKLEHVVVYSTTRERREAFAKMAAERLGIPVIAAEDARQAVDGLDIVACATSSFDPVFNGEWLRPGQHVNSLQAGELDDLTHDRAEVIGIRAKELSQHFKRDVDPVYGFTARMNRLTDAHPDRYRTLGGLLVGTETGRTHDDAITLFGGTGTGPSSGLGIQFAAAGKVVLDRARERGVGRELPTEWFTEEHHP